MQSPASKHHSSSSDGNKKENEVREGKGDTPTQPIKEGQEKEGLNSEAYPQPGLKDKQYKNQPEFIDRNANDTSKS